MLKRIEARQARTGMFVEGVEGAWSENALQKRRFVLDDATAQHIRESTISNVVINTSKGVDVPAPNGTVMKADSGIVRRVEADAVAARRTIQQSASSLNQMFKSAASGGVVSLEETTLVAAEISNSIDRNPAVFIGITRLKSKDEITFVHSVAVSGLMARFGRHLGLDEISVELLGVAGLLHDIGKIEVPDDILNKQSSLNDAEMNVMRAHPAQGHKILSRQIGMPEMVLDICLRHHEHVDGRGYPDKLSGANVSFFARLAAICDVYDAITTTRPYKKPWSTGEALSWMMARDGQFDQKLLRKFTLCLAVALTE